jgi:hypothetical protein
LRRRMMGLPEVVESVRDKKYERNCERKIA